MGRPRSRRVRRAAARRADAAHAALHVRRRVPHGLLPARPAHDAVAQGARGGRLHDDVEPRGVLARRGARRRAREARHHRRLRRAQGSPREARVEGPPRPHQAVAARQRRRPRLRRRAHDVRRRQRVLGERRLPPPREDGHAPRAHAAAEAHRDPGVEAHRLLRHAGPQAPRGVEEGARHHALRHVEGVAARRLRHQLRRRGHARDDPSLPRPRRPQDHPRPRHEDLGAPGPRGTEDRGEGHGRACCAPTSWSSARRSADQRMCAVVCVRV